MARNGAAQEVNADERTLVTGVSTGGDKLVYFTADAPDEAKYADVVVIGRQRLQVHGGVLHVVDSVELETPIIVHGEVTLNRERTSVSSADKRQVSRIPVPGSVLPNGTNIADKLLAIQKGALPAFARDDGKVEIDHGVEGGRLLVGKAARDLLCEVAEATKRASEAPKIEAEAKIAAAAAAVEIAIARNASGYSSTLNTAKNDLCFAREKLTEGDYEDVARLTNNILRACVSMAEYRRESDRLGRASEMGAAGAAKTPVVFGSTTARAMSDARARALEAIKIQSAKRGGRGGPRH